MLIFVLAALWSIGTILIITAPEREFIRWASAMTFLGSTGFLASVIRDILVPYLNTRSSISYTLEQFLQWFANVCSFIDKNALPYSFLMFAISYGNYFSRFRKNIAYVCSLPILIMFFITPIYPELKINYIVITAWAGPYIIFAILLLLRNYYTEKNPMAKRGSLLVNILAIIPLSSYLVTVYILRIFGITEAWKWNIQACFVLFVAFVYFGIRYDVLGIKLRFEKSRLNSTMRAATSGTALFNHAIKNEVGKIHLFLDRIQAATSTLGQESLNRDIQIIMDSTQNLLHLANQFHKQSQDFTITTSSFSLLDIVHEAVSGVEPFLETKQTKVCIDFTYDPVIRCDKFHIKETLCNIIMNAAEAITSNGLISITWNETNKYVTLSIKDNGPGIDKKNLPHVFDPFFSTKNRLENYGLGLSYCYNVMQKHGGLLDIHSVKNMGTTVFLHIPKRKLIYADPRAGI